MMVILCTQCPLALRTIGEVAEVSTLVGERSEFWPNRYACPRCNAPAECHLEMAVPELHRYELRDLSAQELFIALHGLGLPEERTCKLKTVQTLLREVPVRRVVGVDVAGTERCVVHHLELWDGTRLYLGASPEGAVVYRHVPPQRYTEKVHG